MRRRPMLILIAANLLLLAALAWLWLTPTAQLKNSTWEAPTAHKADYAQMLPPLPGTAPVDTSKFVAMLDRPLFILSRRPPPPPPPPEAPPPVDSLSTARIFGVFTSAGVGGGGVIMNAGGKDRRVKINESIDGGWILKSIAGNTATFSRGGHSRVLTMPRADLTTYAGLSSSQAVEQPYSAAPVARESAEKPTATGSAPTNSGARPPRNSLEARRANFGGRR